MNNHLLRAIIIVSVLNLAALVNTQIALTNIHSLEVKTANLAKKANELTDQLAQLNDRIGVTVRMAHLNAEVNKG